MKEKGFTLIELLAVIVILAIIALIATPIVLNIIEDSKDSAKLNSANHYIDAVEQAIMKYNMNSGGDFVPKECEIQSNGNLKCDGKDITVEVDGEKPTSGTITFELGNIVDIELDYDGKVIIKDEDGNFIEGLKKYNNGEIVYYNVENGTVCTEEVYDEANSNTGYNGIDNRIETQNGCMKFYAFNDKVSNETVNLILDHNTTAAVAWTNTSIASNANGPIDVLTAVYSDTSKWEGTITPKNYTMDQSSQASGANYTVEYSKTPSIEGAVGPYKARLITAQEIAQITGADITLNWDERLETSEFYYFDGAKGTDPTWRTQIANGTTPSDYGWLYDRTSTVCTTYGCSNNSDIEIQGYWTVSSRADHTGKSWRVGSIGSMVNSGVGVTHDASDGYGDGYGVRPVIEVLKSNLS